MSRGFGHALGNGGLTVGDNAITHGVDLESEPFGGGATFSVVGFAVMVDATDLTEAVVLLKLTGGIGVINGVGLASAGFDDGKTRNIAGAIRDIDHVLQRDAAVFGFDVGIHINSRISIGALVDFENRFGFGRVVDDHADLGDFGFGGNREFVLLQESRLEGVLDEFTGPRAIDFAGGRTAPNHFGQAGAHDVVFQRDIVFAVFRLFPGKLPTPVEEVRHPGIEFNFRAALAQDAIV